MSKHQPRLLNLEELGRPASPVPEIYNRHDEAYKAYRANPSVETFRVFEAVENEMVQWVVTNLDGTEEEARRVVTNAHDTEEGWLLQAALESGQEKVRELQATYNYCQTEASHLELRMYQYETARTERMVAMYKKAGVI